MTPPLFRRYGWILTHLLAAGVGWAMWTAMRPEVPEKKSAGKEPLQRENLRRERHERRESDLSGDELLTRLAGKSPFINRTSPSMTYEIYLQQQEDRVVKEADALAPAADVAAAAIAGIEIWNKLQAGMPLTEEEQRESGNLSARLLHWMRLDPEASIAFASNIKNSYGLDAVLGVIVREKGPVAAAGWIGANPKLSDKLQRSIVLQAGREGSPEMMAALKPNFPVARWNEMRVQMAGHWPMEKSADLLAMAQADSAPVFLLGFARKQGQAGLDWLKQEMASGRMDPEFQAALMKKPEYRDLYLNNPKTPLAERLEVMASFSPDKDKEQLKLEIGTRDVSKVLDAGRDWRYAFRTGAVTMDEIYATVAAELPELAASSSQAIKLQLFKELAEDNGPAAIAMLDQFPAEQKWQTAIKPVQYMYYQVNPQEFYDYLQHIPADAGDDVWDTRLNAWSSHTRSNHQRLDTEYVDWVKNLPEGLDREMASYALLRDLGDKNPGLSEELLASIKDPKLQQRLNSKR